MLVDLNMPADSTTLVEILLRRFADGGERDAIRICRDGQIEPVSWNRLAEDVRRAAVVLRDLGVAPGDRVAQLSENRYEWIVADLAILLLGGVHVPLHASLSPGQVAFQIGDSEARAVLASTREQLKKLSKVRKQLPPELRVLVYDKTRPPRGLQPDRFRDAIDAADAGNAAEIERQATQHVTSDTLATILYTSGTTGEPKGVMLSHGNLATNAQSVLSVYADERQDVRLCLLPLSHIYARTCDLYTFLAAGSILALAQRRETIMADIKLTQPTRLNAVPYFYEKVKGGLENAGAAEQPGSLRRALGERIEMCFCGGAPLPTHVFDFFESQGVPLLEGYGLTESSPVITASGADAYRRGSCGQTIPGVEVRIADDGEILTRGPHVMQGYWKQPDDTALAIEDDWLHTGDLGRVDDDGFLYITGRKKEIIVTSSGKNIAPAMIESLLAADPLVAQAVVFGDNQKYLAAIIVPEPDHLRSEMKRRRIRVWTKRQALAHPEVRELYQAVLDVRLAELSHHEQVRRFRLLGRGFTVESGELTPTLKLRRDQIARNLAQEIEELFAE